MLQTTLMFCTLAAVAVCAPEKVPHHPAPADLNVPIHVQETPETGQEHDVQKRSPGYNFGLGKRAYSYVSEYKRLPVYNFGLGKRSAPYPDGLGERSSDDEDLLLELDPAERQALAELIDRYEREQDDELAEVKRARPYSFGLGKRYAEEDSNDQEKRSRMYEFGLGKRTPYYNFGLGKRQPGRSYSFGLGKRLSPGKFNFGLGKRERDANRFNFGLGKRSATADLGSEELDEENNA